MKRCPNTTEAGCRCHEHHPGLGIRPALVKPPLRLAPPVQRICHGYQHGCNCPSCTDRSSRGGKLEAPAQAIRQPWEPRPARHAA